MVADIYLSFAHGNEVKNSLLLSPATTQKAESRKSRARSANNVVGNCKSHLETHLKAPTRLIRTWLHGKTSVNVTSFEFDDCMRPIQAYFRHLKDPATQVQAQMLHRSGEVWLSDNTRQFTSASSSSSSSKTACAGDQTVFHNTQCMSCCCVCSLTLPCGPFVILKTDARLARS